MKKRLMGSTVQLLLADMTSERNPDVNLIITLVLFSIFRCLREKKDVFENINQEIVKALGRNKNIVLYYMYFRKEN